MEIEMSNKITEEHLEDALWFPDMYDWDTPADNSPRPTQGGGTAQWDKNLKCYVFVVTPDWALEFKPGDPVPSEWGIL